MLSALISDSWHGTDLEVRVSIVGIIATFFVWRLLSVLTLYSLRPKNMKISGKTLLFGKWLSELDFILKGADRLVETAEKLGNAVFAIPALSCYQVLVSARDQVIEFAKASEDTMSFRAAMNERLFFKHTMFGFELNDVDPDDSIPRRVAKVHVRQNLHILGPILNAHIDRCFKRLEKDKGIGNMIMNISVFDLAKSVVARMNSQLLFGDELAASDDFEKQTIRYAWHTIILMQILRGLPAVLVPVVAIVFRICSGSMNKVGEQVRFAVMKRLKHQSQGRANAQTDGIDWVISCSTTSSQSAPQRIVQQMVALLFASMHQMQMATTWAIIDLCTHREFIEPLRAEIHSVFEGGVDRPYDKLHLMDSFLRESSRLNPLDGLTIQRKALKSFTFSDGCHIPAGNLVSVPQRVVMQDGNRYPDPQRFNPYRYMKSSVDTEAPTTKYSDVNWDYTFWGSPRKSCPGRWYASYALKHVLVYLLTRYNFSLDNPQRPRYFIWTTAVVPRSDVYLSLQKIVD